MFLAIAFRLRTLLTSATFRPYSGADNVAPIVTQVFLYVKQRRKCSSQIYFYVVFKCVKKLCLLVLKVISQQT